MSHLGDCGIEAVGRHYSRVNSSTTRRGTSAPPKGSRLGDRVRALRVSAGLTQTDLAGDRFSKEYISQIERGKTRPTPETVGWLASRLGVDATFLASGVSSDQRARTEAILTRAEAQAERREFAAAVEGYTEARAAIVSSGAAELQVRALTGEAWARAHLGEVRPAIHLLEEARALAEGPQFTDLDRADVLFRLGVARYLISSIASAVALLGEALALVERSPLPSDVLRANIFTWRSRCYRRQRDFEAAREDVERALELAEAMQDVKALGEAYFQASLIAERDGHWVLARTYAEKAKAQYEELTDRLTVGHLLNNLGGLEFLLGKPEQAVARLQEAFGVVLEHGDDGDVATVVSSLAQVHLKTGEPAKAEEHARHALNRLEEGSAPIGGADRMGEIGNARLVLGRALLDQDRLDEAEEVLALAEDAFAQLSSGSHRAAAWIALGDLAQRRGDDRASAALYRRAAEALQDFRF
jgi:tetratricopeptide (TPR) repeat protein